MNDIIVPFFVVTMAPVSGLEILVLERVNNMNKHKDLSDSDKGHIEKPT